MTDTEARDARNAGLETWSTPDVLATLLEGQTRALQAVSEGLSGMAAAVDAAADRLREGNGRLVYTGAGTSGRLAVLDGVELTPTFGWPRARLVFALAGGLEAMTGAVEGAEDDAAAGADAMGQSAVWASDVVIGVAASGRTPFTCAAVEAARASGALTVGLSCNAQTPLLAAAEHGILLPTGAEVLAGSTRMGAGTAQKAALNLISTALMTRLHKVHQGYMVDMLPTNAKLVARAINMVARIAGVSQETATSALQTAEHRIKPAVLVANGVALARAEEALEAANGDLAAALATLGLS